MKIVAVDTGGTFTDIIAFINGKFIILKVNSTPEDPSKAVINGIKTLEVDFDLLIHGSTVATNTLIERKGARVAFITNKDFEDIIEIGRQNRSKLYDLHYSREQPLIPENLRFGIQGRIDKNGKVIEELNEKELSLLKKNIEKTAEAAAICLLFSFMNPEHESKVKKILEETGIPVFASHEILPEFREFERASTTVANAYVAPKMGQYIEKLSQYIGAKKLRIMQSNGGIISASEAKQLPIKTILSGPAGGVIGALFVGKAINRTKLITLDMGGTSTDVSLIDNDIKLTTEAEITGIPVKTPMIEIHTIGAGGGSIARIDEGGALKVGPESAGADPGPICYGKGKEITVTDANMFLKRLPWECFLDGKAKIYPELIPTYMKSLAKKTGLTEYQLAEGIITVANSNMERAIRVVSVEKGYDPREFALFVFGGAGGLHACFLAENLEIPEVIIPPNPGIFSAFGMLTADYIKDFSKSVMLEEPDYNKISEYILDLEEKAVAEMKKENIREENVEILRFIDARYKGQSYELTVAFTPNFRENFERTHELLYGYRLNRELEVINVRVKAVGRTKKPSLSRVPPKDFSKAFIGEKRIFLKGEFVKAPLYKRHFIPAGVRISGPCIIAEYSSTTFVADGFEAFIDEYGNIIMRRNS